MAVHIQARPYDCRYCGKAFSQKQNMEAHERTHNGETRYLCQQCGKTFVDMSGLRKHQKSHQSSQPVKVKVEDIEQIYSVK
ncbi:unnamed protein product [Acanthoscelides obtectus]|nr:unnamed protein product [Acanthoscelides obtectus]CAK1647635.1 Zinc finger protein 782 [Acanthoscelides obtectus]